MRLGATVAVGRGVRVRVGGTVVGEGRIVSVGRGGGVFVGNGVAEGKEVWVGAGFGVGNRVAAKGVAVAAIVATCENVTGSEVASIEGVTVAVEVTSDVSETVAEGLADGEGLVVVVGVTSTLVVIVGLGDAVGIAVGTVVGGAGVGKMISMRKMGKPAPGIQAFNTNSAPHKTIIEGKQQAFVFIGASAKVWGYHIAKQKHIASAIETHLQSLCDSASGTSLP